MYARYIPPPKGGNPPAPKREVEAPPSPAIASATSATPYARYVPPARTAPRVTPSFASSGYNSFSAPTPAPRAPPPSKTHLNAAAIPAPESLAPKIVFNYDDEDEPAPSKKRKIDSPEPAAEPEVKKPRKEKKAKSGEVKQKKDKKSKEKKEAAVEEDHEEGSGNEKAETPRNSSKQKFAFDFDENVVDAESTPTVIESIPKAKKKKERKEKGPIEDGTAKGPDTAKSPSKEKKRKSRRDNEDGDDDGISRHKGVLERAAKALKEGQKPKPKKVEEVAEEDGAEPIEAHGLEPLPQPEPVAQDGSKPSYETLPAWIANPIRVTPNTNAPFTDLGLSADQGISKEVAAKLKIKGYENAFAVQTAVIPLLLPNPDRQGDVVVSAATGSGKTLSYVLPMVRDISQGVVTRLRAVIVVPTRELVLQAEGVCEACASAFSGPKRKTVRIGISMGNKQFEQEQSELVEEEQRWDPEGHQKWLEGYFAQDKEPNFSEDEAPKPLPNHVIDYVSKVDILICTPGRLVDHINRTAGFTLDYVRWLVVDEADKLLAQTFQEWLPVVMPLLNSSNKPDARAFTDSNKAGVRKVVLSATMTRDLSLLNGLKLSRPKLVTLESSRGEKDQAHESKTEHVLPELLEESAMKVREPGLKPLYLVDLLSSPHISSVDGVNKDVDMKDAAQDSASSSDSDSELESSDSDISSDDSDSDSEGSNAGSSPSSSSKKITAKAFTTTALIFTRSNEAAIRLSRLLSLLAPHLKPLIGTLTSTTRSSQRRKTLQAFTSRKLRILVASDLVARGIDLTNLDHVINYDMPTSVASYIHRVGRTARAGLGGKAWTLFTKTEAGWFWTAIAGKGESKSQHAAGAGQIKRKGKVGEIKIDDKWDEERLAAFEGALEKLGQEASEMRKKKSR